MKPAHPCRSWEVLPLGRFPAYSALRPGRTRIGAQRSDGPHGQRGPIENDSAVSELVTVFDRPRAVWEHAGRRRHFRSPDADRAPGQPYLVRAADGITLIDAGGFGQEEAIAQALKNWGERRCAAWC